MPTPIHLQFWNVCEYCCLLQHLTYIIVKRVHWLRARAQYHRWNEELLLIGHEMVWTVRYYLYKSNRWGTASATFGISPGAAAYAKRKQVMWRHLAQMADNCYQRTNVTYSSPM